jgi:hypothetical protein
MPNPACGYSVRLGGMQRAAGRKAGWATAWQPGPATEATRVPRALAAWSPRATRAQWHARRRPGGG